VAKGGTQVTIGGEIRMRGDTRHDTSDLNRNVSGGGGFGSGERIIFDSRVRLNVQAKLSPNTIGFIQIEAAGNGLTGENTDWGGNGDGSTGCRSFGGSQRCGEYKVAPMNLQQAWLQHSGSGLLGIPAYFKIGHQPVTIGQGIFYRHTLFGDDAIIAGITPVKGLDLSVAYVKMSEGITGTPRMSSDDQDLYSFLVNYAINKDIAIGADVSLLQTQNNAISANVKSNLWNIAANGKANVSGFKLNGEIAFQTGTQKYPTYNDWSFNGFAGNIGVKYTFAPVTLGLDLGYGSGDRKADNKISTFQTSQAHVRKYPGTLIFEYWLNTPAGGYSGGLQNTMYAQLNAQAEVMKGLVLSPSVTFIKAARKAYGVTNNGAANATPANNSYNSCGIDVQSSYVGTEVDLGLTYQIDKGLRYFVESGYLFAGNFWKGATGRNKISDPWAVRHGIVLSF
jgi:hypothetical protein